MSDTKLRLDELSYIYNQMIQTPSDKYTAFFANLHSFLSLARSVTNVMQKEYAHTAGFREWYSHKQNEMRKDADMKFLYDLRSESLKEKSVGDTKIKFKIINGFTLQPKDVCFTPSLKYTGDGFVLDKDDNVYVVNGQRRPDIKFEFSTDYYFTKKPNVSAKLLCDNHLKKLIKLVNECDDKFLHQKNTKK